MSANTRFLTLLGGCIAVVLVLTACQSSFSTQEILEQNPGFPEEIGDTGMAVDTLHPTVEQLTIRQTPTEYERSTTPGTVDVPASSSQTPTETVVELTAGSLSEEVADQPIEVSTFSPTDTPEPRETYLGDAVEGWGYFISATNVDTPAELDNYSQPEEGMKLVAIDTIMGLTVSGRGFISQTFYLNDNEGSFYYPEEPLHDYSYLSTDIRFNHGHVLIFAGEKVRWLVVFKIPENAIPTKLNYVHERWANTNKKLSIGLSAPPEGHQANFEILNIPPEKPVTKLGETSRKFGYSISAQGVNDPVEPNWDRVLNSGEKLVAVDVIFENESNTIGSISLGRFYLVDNFGYLYTPDISNIGDPVFSEKEDLLPGDNVRVWVAFTIPEDASAYILKYEKGIWRPEDYLQVGLTE